MRGHVHSDVLSLALATTGVFAMAHVIRIIAAKAGTANSPMIAAFGKGVGGFFTLG